MQNSHTFIMVARVLYDKGYTEYVEAAKIVKSLYPYCSFELLGPIDEKSPMGVPRSVVEQHHADGFIDYLGVTANVVPYLDRPNLVAVLPSFYPEGLNRFLMEACAMGCPIITSDIPGCRETVDVGVNGYLVEPRNYYALALSVIRYLMLDGPTQQQMAVNSRIKAETDFDIRKVISQYDTIIDDLKAK